MFGLGRLMGFRFSFGLGLFGWFNLVGVSGIGFWFSDLGLC